MKIIKEQIKNGCRQLGFDQTGTDEVGALLSSLCASKPRGRFLELGTGCGLSTAWMLEGMDEASRLISVDNRADVLAVARAYLGDDPRLTLIEGTGKEVIDAHPAHAFDVIFADTWPGKYHYLDEALELLSVGGLYIIDDMLPQANWPDGHEAKVANLIQTLESRDDLIVSRLDWATGVILCTKTANTDHETNTWNPNNYRNHASFVSELALPVVDLLAPKAGERILDLGCGDGTLGLEIIRRGAEVLGVDLSKEMVAKAQANGLDAEVMSVTNLPFRAEFDAVFSNAMLHWVREPELAVANIARSLKPGGRFVAEFGGAGNVHHIIEAMRTVFARHPEFGVFDDFWYFPTPEAYAEILERHGFDVPYIELIPRPTPIDDIAHWLAIFTNGVTEHLDEAQTAMFREEVRERLKSTNYTDEKGWVADYVRLRVRAVMDDR